MASAVDGASYTYAYNDANELTTMNLDGVETHFTYDDWGRTASKYVGDGSVLHAEYGYRYGDKLKQVNSTFPGKKDEVHFIHDGLGKRRSSVIAMSESSSEDAIWAKVNHFDAKPLSECEANVPPPDCFVSRRLLPRNDDTTGANSAMEREWYCYDAGWNVVGQHRRTPQRERQLRSRPATVRCSGDGGHAPHGIPRRAPVALRSHSVAFARIRAVG